MNASGGQLADRFSSVYNYYIPHVEDGVWQTTEEKVESGRILAQKSKNIDGLTFFSI